MKKSKIRKQLQDIVESQKQLTLHILKGSASSPSPESDQLPDWHVRWVNSEGVYHPQLRGFVVKQAPSAIAAMAMVRQQFHPDNEEGGEFQGWELTADVLEYRGDVAEL